MILSFTKRGDDKTGFKIVLSHFIEPSIRSNQYIHPSCVPIKSKPFDRHGDEDRTLPFNFDFHFRDPFGLTE
jgi:hypothetical protein